MKNYTFLKKLLSVGLAMSMLLIAGCGNEPGEDEKKDPESESSSESSSSSEESEPEPIELRDPVDLTEKLNGGIERNADTVAWLYIPELGIDDAVVQKNDPNKSREDNLNYYLRITEDLKYDIFGCYFAEPSNGFGTRSDLSKNTIVYGHSDYKDNRDGKKFSKLFAYNDIEFLKENPYIYLSTENEDLVFQVFSVFYADINHFTYNWANPTDEIYKDIIKGAIDRSEYIMDVDVDPATDKIITLSTCTGQFVPGNKTDYRYVIMGKLLPNTDVPAGPVEVTKNPNPHRD